MYEPLEVLRIGLSLILLFFASWQDYKLREVSDKFWIVFAPSGLLLSLFHVFLFKENLITLLVSFLVLTGISFAMFYAGFFGGADAKALICLSLAIPFQPSSVKPYLTLVSPLFSLSVFSNAVLFSALSAIGIFFFNLTTYAMTRERLFDGLEHESSPKKFLALLTGYKVRLSVLKETFYLVPLEEYVEKEDGKIMRRLKLFIRTDEDREADLDNLTKFSEEENRKIWATPYLPLLVFITIGLVVALFFGDIILWMVANLFSLF